MFEMIKSLCELDGISGREQDVSAAIMEHIRTLADEVSVDNLGNVIAFKKGRRQPKHKLMVAAHMDEVGMIVTSIGDDGYLRFSTVGGVNTKVILGRQVRVGEKKLPGVIGSKPIHLQSEEERSTAPELDKMVIDIGAKDREEAERCVSLGDSATFIGDYLEYGNPADPYVAVKAMDDRAGCAMMIQMMKEGLEFDTWFAFTVQEEIGTRGAKAAAFSVNPDIALIIETTASGDVADVTGEKRVTIVGGGAVVSYMDHGTIYDKPLFDLAFQVAKEKSIPCQTKTMIAGGNDSGAIHVSHGGVRTCAISVPGRYLHSPSDAAKKSDIQAVYDLSKAMLDVLGDC